MGKSAPSPPDPVETAEAQAEYNREAAYDSSKLNQIGQETPWGSVVWTGQVGDPDRTQHTFLAPVLGRILFGEGYGDGGLADALARRTEDARAARSPEEKLAEEILGIKERMPLATEDQLAAEIARAQVAHPISSTDAEMDRARKKARLEALMNFSAGDVR